MQSSYAEAIRRLLLSEGGYINHPSDPGGPTNFGITLTDYRKYVKPSATAADIRAMKVEEARVIYRAKYWGAIRADELPAGVDYCLFDYVVNSGTGRAPKVLQRVMGIAVSGRVDDATVRAAAARDAAAMVTSICDERLRFLQGLKTWPVFGKGWARRVAEVKAAALVMARRAALPAAASAAPKTDTAPVTRAPSIVPEAPPPTRTAGKGEVPESAGLKNAVKVSGPGGFATFIVSAKAWVIAHPIETGLIAAVVVVAVVGIVWLVNRWRQARQERPMAVHMVPAIAA